MYYDDLLHVVCLLIHYFMRLQSWMSVVVCCYITSNAVSLAANYSNYTADNMSVTWPFRIVRCFIEQGTLTRILKDRTTSSFSWVNTYCQSEGYIVITD